MNLSDAIQRLLKLHVTTVKYDHPTIDEYIDTHPGTPATLGDLTGTPPVTITDGTNAVIGLGTSIEVEVADATHVGVIDTVDWNRFDVSEITARRYALIRI